MINENDIIDKECINFLIELNKNEELNPSQTLLGLIEKETTCLELKNTLKSKYEPQTMNYPEKVCDLTILRMYEILNDENFKITARVEDILNLHQYINQDVLEDVTLRDYGYISKEANKHITHVEPSRIKDFLNYDFKEDIQYFRIVETREDYINRIFWKVARLYETYPFPFGNIRDCIIFAIKLVESSSDKKPDLTKVKDRNFKNILFSACYENFSQKIERNYEPLDNFINSLL